MQRFVLLRGAHVVQHGSGGDGGGLMADQAEAFERTHIQLALDQRHGEVAGPDPVFHAGAGSDTFQCRGSSARGREQHFAGAGHQDFVDGLLARCGAGELSGAKFAGGNVEQRDCADRDEAGSAPVALILPDGATSPIEIRSEEVVLLLAQARRRWRCRAKARG